MNSISAAFLELSAPFWTQLELVSNKFAQRGELLYHNSVIYLWATLLILLNAFWLLLNLLALPGNLLIAVTTTLLAWWQWDCGKGLRRADVQPLHADSDFRLGDSG